MIGIILFCILVFCIFVCAIMIPEDDSNMKSYEYPCYDKNIYKCGKCGKHLCKYHKIAKIADDIEKTNFN